MLLPSASRSSTQSPFITFPYPKKSTRATCPAHLILLYLMNQYFVGNTNNDAPHYVIFSSILSLPPSQAQTSPSHDNLILCSSPKVHTKFHTHTKQQNYSSLYFNLHVIRQRTVRQKILHRMPAGIPGVQSAINSPKHATFVCLCCSQGRNRPEVLPTCSPDSVDANTKKFTHRMRRTQILEHKQASAATLRYHGTPLCQSPALTLPYGISNPSAQFANSSQVGFPLVLESRNIM